MFRPFLERLKDIWIGLVLAYYFLFNSKKLHTL